MTDVGRYSVGKDGRDVGEMRWASDAIGRKGQHSGIKCGEEVVLMDAGLGLGLELELWVFRHDRAVKQAMEVVIEVKW